MAELEIVSGPLDEIGENLLNAIDAASDQGQGTWITTGGKRIARIVTVEDGELLEKLDRITAGHEAKAEHVIRDGQIVSWGPVSDAPWKPGQGHFAEWLTEQIHVKDQP